MFLAVILFWSCLTLYHFRRVKCCNDIRNSRIRLGGLVKIAEIRLISEYPCTLAMRGVEASRLALGNIAVLKGVPGSHLCSFKVAVQLVTTEIHLKITDPNVIQYP